VEWLKSVLPEAVLEKWREMRGWAQRRHDNNERGAVTVGGVAGEEMKVEAYGEVKDGVGAVVGYDHGVKEAEKLNESENASGSFALAMSQSLHK